MPTRPNIFFLSTLLACLLAWLPEVNAQKTQIEAAFAEKVDYRAGKLTADIWNKASAYPLELLKYNQRDWTEARRKHVGNTLREKGSVKLLWNREYLYVGVEMEDSDVVADGTADQTHLYTMGDTIEVFIKPQNETYYWEIYGTPNNLKTVFFYPGRGRFFVPSSADHPVDVDVAAAVDGTLNDWKNRDRGWSVIIAIPVKMLEKHGKPFNTEEQWTLMVGRQNYSACLPLKEASSYPALSLRDFHLYEEYAELILNPENGR